jgi:hypothetical protein
MSIAVGDFNKDGMLDLAVGNYAGSGVLSLSNFSILLGNGDGSFQAPTTYTLNTQATPEIVVGDFNDDGNLDLAFSDADHDNNAGVYVALGNGDGTFQVPELVASPSGPKSPVVADLNGDGKLDIAFTQDDSDLYLDPSKVISVLLGNGNGTFQPAVNYASSSLYPGLTHFGMWGGPLVADIKGKSRPHLRALERRAELGQCFEPFLPLWERRRYVPERGGPPNIPEFNSGGWKPRGFRRWGFQRRWQSGCSDAILLWTRLPWRRLGLLYLSVLRSRSFSSPHILFLGAEFWPSGNRNQQ